MGLDQSLFERVPAPKGRVVSQLQEESALAWLNTELRKAATSQAGAEASSVLAEVAQTLYGEDVHP